MQVFQTGMGRRGTSSPENSSVNGLLPDRALRSLELSHPEFAALPALLIPGVDAPVAGATVGGLQGLAGVVLKMMGQGSACWAWAGQCPSAWNMPRTVLATSSRATVLMDGQ